jgi:[ribosomal protein S5]-alanine N-acetyltransferase
MIFELNTCSIRPWKEDDIHSLVHHADNRNVWMNVRDTFPHPYTILDGQRWIMHAQSLGDIQFTIVVNGKSVGGIGLIPQTDVFVKSMELGYWLGEEYWGRGIITESVQSITNYAFEHFDINRLFANVFDWNPASARVLEKNGFVFEGRMKNGVYKNGRVGDLLLYAITKDLKE